MASIGSTSSCDTTTSGGINYPQAVGRLVLDLGAVMILRPGATFVIHPGYTLNQETVVQAGSTLEIKV